MVKGLMPRSEWLFVHLLPPIFSGTSFGFSPLRSIHRTSAVVRDARKVNFYGSALVFFHQGVLRVVISLPLDYCLLPVNKRWRGGTIVWQTCSPLTLGALLFCLRHAREFGFNTVNRRSPEAYSSPSNLTAFVQILYF